MVLYILVVFVSLLFLFFIYISWNENYWIKQKIPFVEPEKLFGNVRDVVLMKRTIGEVYEDIYRRLDGKPLGGFFKMRTPILMIRDPELIRSVLVTKFNDFHDNDIHIRRDADPILKMNPFLAKGPTWESTRSSLAPLQEAELLDGMLQIIKSYSGELVEYLRKQDVPVEVKNLCSKYTSDVIAACALGSSTNSFKKSNDQFKYMSRRLLRKDFKSNAALLFALYAPFIGNMINLRIVTSQVSEYFIGLISSECRQRVRERVRKQDFLQRLIDINKESEASGEGTAYSYKQITGHCMTIFLDGYQMTSYPLCFCLYEIAMHPQVQDNLRAELASNGIKSIDFLSRHTINDLKYLDMVFKESLRLHPPMETITRVCSRECELEADNHRYSVSAGTPVTVPVRALHRDPAHYPQPALFRPERFTPLAVQERHPCVYLPFGAGPRECPGSKFAELILKTAIIAVLLDFDVSPRGNIEKIKPEPMSSLLAQPRGTIWLRFRPRVESY